MDSIRVDFDDIPWTVPMPNVRFKAHIDGRRQLRIVEFGEGFVEPEWCLRGHVGLVLEGTGRLQFQQSATILKAGDGIFIPAGERHRHRLTVLGKVLRVFLVEDLQ